METTKVKNLLIQKPVKKIKRDKKENCSDNLVSRSTAMAQLDRLHKSSETSRTPRAQTSPTFEQLLLGDTSSRSASISPTLGRRHDQEEDINHHNKKSVLTKVKEKAKKLRYTLSGKKKHGNEIHDDNISPSWRVRLEDDEEDDEDPEYLGAPMYESELAPENYKEAARQHPRTAPAVPEGQSFAGCMAASPNKAITLTMSEKLAPAYEAASDATHIIASKIAGLTINDPKQQEIKNHTGLTAAPSEASDLGHIAGPEGNSMMNLERWSETREHSTNSPQKWDKGISVKEYFLQKLEPGEDERALSQVISEAISPRKSPGDMGLVEKVKEAVTSFLRPEEPSHSMTRTSNASPNVASSTTANRSPHNSSFTTNINPSSHIPISNSVNSSPLIPVSTNAHEEIEEQNHGRILQAN